VRRIGLGIVLATSLLVPGWTPAARADTVLAHLTRATLVNAYNGTVVWSAFDDATQAYRLTAYQNGTVTTLPIPAGDSVFDADLGPDASGALTVVYSRCQQRRAALPFIAAPTTADCDLYRYRFGAPGEERIDNLSRTGTSEYLPSIWGNRLAFARTRTDARGGNCVTSVWLGDLRTGQQRRLATGALGKYRVPPPCHKRTEPTSIDVRARVIAFSWYYAPRGCDDGSQLWLIRLPRKPKLIESRCGGYRFTPVSLTTRRLFEMSFGSVRRPSVPYFEPNLRSFDIRSGRYYESLRPNGDTFAVSDGSKIYALRRGDPSTSSYDVVSEPLAGFKRSRRDTG
jgi:hypothetical protein